LNLTNANGTVTDYTYNDQRGWVTRIHSYHGATAIQDLQNTRNTEGQITQVTSPFTSEGWTYAYDVRHQLTSATNANDSSATQTFQYSNDANVTSNSRLGAYSYPASGTARPHAVTGAGTNTYAYDARGQMTSGAGRSITWNRDGLAAS